MLRKVEFTCVGQMNLIFGKQHFTPKIDGETADSYEDRTWMNRLHLEGDTDLIFPSIAFVKSLKWGAEWNGTKIKGRGSATYTKRFKSGVRPLCGYFPVFFNGRQATTSDVFKNSMSVPPSPKVKTRVIRHFPTLPVGWSIDVQLLLVDSAIKENIFISTLEAASFYDGLGAMRMGSGYPNGVYSVEDLKFSEWKFERSA